MKPGIMNLTKWTEKTAQAVRHICLKKKAPCVGFCLVFFDPMAAPEERWNYVIELAFDAANPPTEEEQKQVRRVFEFLSEGIKRIVGGKPGQEDLEDFTKEVRWD